MFSQMLMDLTQLYLKFRYQYQLQGVVFYNLALP